MPAYPVSGGKILSSKPLLGTDESSGQSNVGQGVWGQSLGTSTGDAPSPNLPQPMVFSAKEITESAPYQGIRSGLSIGSGIDWRRNLGRTLGKRAGCMRQ